MSWQRFRGERISDDTIPPQKVEAQAAILENPSDKLLGIKRSTEQWIALETLGNRLGFASRSSFGHCIKALRIPTAKVFRNGRSVVCVTLANARMIVRRIQSKRIIGGKVI